MIQEEIKEALDIWRQKLDSDIYIIPLRLEECKIPEILEKFQWLDYFRDDGWRRLVKSIREGMARLGMIKPDSVVLLNFKGSRPKVTDNDGNPIDDATMVHGRNRGSRALEWMMPGGYMELLIELPQPHDLTAAHALKFWAWASKPIRVEVQLKDQNGAFTKPNPYIQLFPKWGELQLSLDQFTLQPRFDATLFQKIVFWFKAGSDNDVVFKLDKVWMLKR
jgi:hypothetical protein